LSPGKAVVGIAVVVRILVLDGAGPEEFDAMLWEDLGARRAAELEPNS